MSVKEEDLNEFTSPVPTPIKKIFNKDGSERKKRKPNKRAGVEPDEEGKIFVQTIEEINSAISDELKFTDKDRRFHEKTVSLTVKQYGISLLEYILALMIAVSCIKILWMYFKFALKKIRELSEDKPEKKPNEQNLGNGPESVGEEFRSGEVPPESRR